jgi:RNase P subunit RPR2
MEVESLSSGGVAVGCFAGRTAAMAIVDQKERYRRQAALCYEIAATMAGERAISMARLGDTYAALATDPDRLLPNVFASRKKYVDPVCKKCGQKMQLTHSLPRTEIMPPMQAFRCDACKETLIWKGEVSSVRAAQQSQGAAFLPKVGGSLVTSSCHSGASVATFFRGRPWNAPMPTSRSSGPS